YELALPVGADGVYAASVYPHDVTRQRVIALDQYAGAPLLDVHFTDLGPVGRAIQYGIGIHKGEQWGRANQLAMLAFCLATRLLATPFCGVGAAPSIRRDQIMYTRHAALCGGPLALLLAGTPTALAQASITLDELSVEGEAAPAKDRDAAVPFGVAAPPGSAP